MIVKSIVPLLSLGVGFTLVHTEIYSEDRVSVNIYCQGTVGRTTVKTEQVLTSIVKAL